MKNNTHGALSLWRSIMAASRFSIIIFLFVVFTLHHPSFQVSGELVLEDGYTVSTVIDGNKLGINPHSVLPRSGPSDLVILDSSSNAFFTVSFPISQGSVINRLSGNGAAGYSDGDSTSAMFNRPRSFAVDTKGNVYVADKNNRVIRKISKLGVTTIAGGYTRKTGYIDGPAQNASFSDDFELAFAPQICALLISDHGSKVIRQIILKPDDCASGSRPVLGATSIWILGLGVSCILGLIIGFAIRPYIIPHEGSRAPHFSMTWKHCLINLGKQVAIFCFDIRNAIASSTLYLLVEKLILLSLSQLSLMFGLNFVDSRASHIQSVSLLDSDNLHSGDIRQSELFAEELKDLVNFNGSLELSHTSEITFQQGDDNQERIEDNLSKSRERIDNMILANIMDFVEVTQKTTALDESLLASSGLVKRR